MFAAPLDTSVSGSLPLLDIVRDLAQIGVLLLMFVAGPRDRSRADATRWQSRVLVGVRRRRAAVRRRRRSRRRVRAAAVLAGHLHRHGADCHERQHLRTDIDGDRRVANARRIHDSCRGGHRRCDGNRRAVDRRRAGEGVGVGELSMPAHSRSSSCGWSSYFAVAIYAGRWLPGVLRWASGTSVSQAMLAAVLVVAFIYGWAAEYSAAWRRSPELTLPVSSLRRLVSRKRLIQACMR